MVDAVAQFLDKYLSAELAVFIISMLPILELRGGLVAAKLLSVPWASGYALSILGNMLPVPFVLHFITPIMEFLKTHGPIKKLMKKIEDKGFAEGKKLMEKYPTSVFVGLFLFVAIPLPGTGAWTGALIASILNLDKKKSFVAIAAGVFSASIIMSVLAYLIPNAFGF